MHFVSQPCGICIVPIPARPTTTSIAPQHVNSLPYFSIADQDNKRCMRLTRSTRLDLQLSGYCMRFDSLSRQLQGLESYAMVFASLLGGLLFSFQDG
jgi:hypothetical protein